MAGASLVARAAILTAVFACAAPAAEPARSESAAPVAFSSAVNWDFPRHDKLDAWRNSAIVLRKTLAHWAGREVPGAALENCRPPELRALLAGLPRAGGWSIVYLASHQTRDGRWQFPPDEQQSWPAILGGLSAPPENRRLLILDACFAAVADREALIDRTGAAGLVFTAARAEEVHELNFRHRFPLDLPRRFPTETQWLREALGPEWNGRISFFGFIWLRTFLTTPQAPHTLADWTAFFQRCEENVRQFRQTRGKARAASIEFVPRAFAAR